MAGRGSLPGLLAYGNANNVVMEMAKKKRSMVKHTPGLAGANGTDPFMIRDAFLDDVGRMGFWGYRTFPRSD